MPKGPKGEKRFAAVVENAVYVMRVATGEIKGGADANEAGKDPVAASLGRKGGLARAAPMSAKRRSEIARRAAQTRFSKHK